MVSNLVSIPGYRINEELYNGSRTIVYRAVRESDSVPVVTKLLKNPYPSFSELLLFRNQYTIGKNLTSPLIIQTYSLESFQNSYMLVMEDFGGISLKDYFTKNQRVASLEEFLVIAIALCDILDLLYHERIIHKDIKPSNILINPETKQVKLIDFSIASLLPRETQTLINPNVLEGTLAYISPEQTGRMNRGIDYRTDFYSLGVTFYELLTGELPFSSNDAMELVHSHIAKTPSLAHEIHPNIPLAISKIFSKLMAKNAEDRYQSALGLKFDLEKCLTQLRETGEIGDFEIASRDLCDRFIIPDKLYGREGEVQTLLEAFERVSQGTTEMMLVAGFSGIGKTAVVNEVHKPIVRQRGYFIKGKYDQFQRNIPFSAFVQAFRDLMGQLLTESDAQIQQWRNKILEAIGDNGQVIIDVIPELENIIGQQPPAVELSGTAAQNRFNLLFQKFTQVFTTKEHPLVIFLDDLQWADSASLKLMQLLMTDTGHLFIIGAYRDNEVYPAHPLMLTLSEIQKKQVIINTITLAPLSKVQVNKLVADTLKCPEELAWNLSVLIHQKTEGNPFFATQFLKSLYQDGLIKFDFELGCWQCDISQVKVQTVTDNVVAFMSLQLQKLPPSTQEVLQLAACIGNSFDLATLAIVSLQSEVETAACLWKALQEGLILPIGDVYKFYVGQEKLVNISANQQTVAYKFIHDRVQQAAYSLIPEAQKQTTHVKIGRLLWSNTPEAEIEEQVFAIANQLNIGIEQFHEPQERHQLSRLNFIAGKKAKASTAYKAALAYLKISIELLPANPWQSDYDFTLSLYNEATEASNLSGEMDLMENFAQEVLQQAKAVIDTAKVYEAKIEAYTMQGKLLAAIDTAMQFLRPIGIEFPPEPTDQDFFVGLQEIQALLIDKTVAELADLPQMQQPELQAALRVLVKVTTPAYVAKPQLHRLLVLKQVALSVKYGNTSASALAYSVYGLMLSGQIQTISTGYEFGQLALQVLSKFCDREYEVRVLVVVYHSISHWQESVTATLKPLIKAYTSGLDTGDLAFAGYGAYVYCCQAYIAGQELTKLANELAIYSAALVKIHQQSALNYTNLYHQVVLNLIEPTTTPWELVGTAYDEKSMLPLHEQTNDGTGLWHFWVNKLMLCYLFEVLDLAVEYAIKAKQYSVSGYAMPNVSLLNWYDSLVQLALYPTASPTQQQQTLQQVAENQKIMEQWANYAPMNQLHRFYLVEAEKHRVLGDKAAAIEFYDLAISQAKANGYIQEEALANEITAKFYLNWEKEKVAAGYMQEAYYCYARWGAKAKVADLENRYPQLLAPILQQSRSLFSTNETIFTLGTVTSTSTSSSSSSVSNTLDLKAILTASQTISGEIELEKLLSSLLRIVIENAGADKCVLMLLRDNRLLIKGSITQGTNPVVLQRIPVEESQDIPHKLIYKVKHSQQTVVLLDVTADITFANDPYIIRQQPQSILCSPILYQGKLLGILYLENNLAKRAFTSDRIELLNLLCTQTAISLENARLYERSQESAQQLERSLHELKTAQSRFHNLVDNVPGVVYQFLMATDGSVSMPYMSSDCYNLYEITAAEAIANVQILMDMTHPEDVDAYRQSIADSAKTLTPWRWEGRIVTPCGITKWIRGESRIEKLADGTLVWDGLVLDISERKQAELALQQANLQIIQSEKMSALGNLVAGVAHEMNNPLGFIAASLKQAKPTFADIIEHLKIYQETLSEKTEEILDHESEIDLEYTIEDLPKMLDSMTMACDRLKNISTSLRTFSRADRDYKVPFNLHEGIDSTILILKHRLKANEQRPAIEVTTKYCDLPQVECFPGQLNQVFMNILANAIDALDESNHGRTFAEIQAHPHSITITTSIADKYVKISIADNGKGMSEEVKHKIFDHLFTTKAVGKGTGLGLAIAKQIIEEKHGGKITVNSDLGEGTEFTIQLPV
ncbi:multi-sensor signal transduction histidine kinase [Calothrix brevissima NIES-22]|nr:multi-sensor signal transduction histidine kinase [Calothrix brevissima NIES-22]